MTWPRYTVYFLLELLQVDASVSELLLLSCDFVSLLLHQR